MKLIKVSRKGSISILLIVILGNLLALLKLPEGRNSKSIYIDSQSLLAGGQKISVKNLTYETLIKLPLTSDSLAKEILKLSKHDFSSEEDLYNSLIKAKGIGVKKAKLYLQFIKHY